MKADKLMRFLAFALVFGLLAFLFKPMLSGRLPIPLDGLAGTYYPWLDFKWGYPAGVPVKNVALTDVFSQLLPWRQLSLSAWRSLDWPLWNPHSFSGTPLLGNWQSAPFYPGNLLMTIFGDLWGWSLMVLLQPVLAVLFMYLYLMSLKLKPVAAVMGGAVFALAGFMTTYVQYNTTGQILIWLPLLLYLTEKFFAARKLKYLIGISLAIFLAAVGGFFQPTLYVYLTFGAYFLFKIRGEKKDRGKMLTLGAVFVGLGLALAAIQLLPTLETLGLSIRNRDANIFEYKFGLLPPGHLLTLFAPDFFGNPVTFNFWGFMQYQETAGYFGITALVLVLTGIVSKKHSFPRNFFTALLLVSLLLAFANPLSRLVYDWKLPAISTGYASRWLMLTGFAAGVLAALGLDSDDRRSWIKFGFLALLVSGLLAAYMYGFRYLATHPFDTFDPQAEKILGNINVAWRNSLYPLALAGALFLASLVLRRWRWLPLILLALVLADLGRFSLKFNPFAPKEMASTDMPVMNFLRDNAGYWRIEKESGPILPSNTWIYFGLSTPSGYDPLVSRQYGQFYRVYNSRGDEATPSAAKISEGNFTRYLERTEYQSPFLDLAGVKYLLMLRRDQDGIIYRDGQKLYYAFDPTQFKRVFEDGTVVVFENPRVIPRVSLWDHIAVEPDSRMALARLHGGFDFHSTLILDASPEAKLKITETDAAEITSYHPNRVEIKTRTSAPTVLMLSDSFYPGWRATINGQPTRIFVADGVYRAVLLPAGENLIVFEYYPDSFDRGLKISLLAAIALGLLGLYQRRKK